MCTPTFMIQAKITDFTDSIYINFARENGTALMGKLKMFHDYRNVGFGIQVAQRKIN